MDIEKLSEFSKSDRLIFSSIQEFDKTISSINPNNLNFLPESLKEFKSKFPNFRSLSETKTEDILKNGSNFRTSNSDPYLTLDSIGELIPDEIKLALSRHEISGNNINELSFVIDRFAGLTYKSSGTGSFTGFSKNVVEPTLSTTKKMYEIEAASVYGASVFLGQLKGIRIIKELND